jgi:hypothetical protein
MHIVLFSARSSAAGVLDFAAHANACFAPKKCPRRLTLSLMREPLALR